MLKWEGGNMKKIAVLYADKNGNYSGLPNVDLYDIERDART